jgi:hypothetical protein
LGCVGLGWAATRAVVLGCQGGLMLGSFAVKIQVRFFSLFFSFIYFLFCISLLISVFNSNFNHSVLQVLDNWSFMKTDKSIMVILNCFD